MVPWLQVAVFTQPRVPSAEPFSRAWEPPTGIYLDEAGPSVAPDLLHIATWGRQAALIKHHQAPLGSQSSLKTVIYAQGRRASSSLLLMLFFAPPPKLSKLIC